MPNIPGVYERARDHYHCPTCWRCIGNTCAPHFHGSLELTYVHKGALNVMLDGEFFTAGRGELVIVPSYSVHHFASGSETDTTVLIIPMDYIRSFQKQIAEHEFAKVLIAAGKTTQEIAGCMRLLIERAAYGSDSYIVRGQIYTILGVLLEAVPLLPSPRKAVRFQTRDILDYLHTNYRYSLSLEQIAREFGYSKSRFSSIFNKNVGCSIPEYVNTLRSRAAANMLLEAGASITDVAMEAGFESLRTYYRSFKNCFGVTPTNFINLSRNEIHMLILNNGLDVI